MVNLLHSVPVSARYMLLSALGFALMAACVKQASHYGIPVLEIVAFRALISLLLSYWDIKRKGLSAWGNNKPLLIARGTAGALALICIYYAISTLPLAEATILQYLHPVFTAVLALLFLKEAIQRSTLCCIVLSLLGLLVLLQPGLAQPLFVQTETPHTGVLQTDGREFSWISYGAALAGALGSAIAYILVRRLSQSEDTSVIIFYFPFIALPISLLLLGDNFVIPTLEALLVLICVGVFTQLGQVGLTKAMQTETAGKATAYSYVQVIFSIVLGVVFFAEVPDERTWIGGGLIICGALLNALWKR